MNCLSHHPCPAPNLDDFSRMMSCPSRHRRYDFRCRSLFYSLISLLIMEGLRSLLNPIISRYVSLDKCKNEAQLVMECLECHLSIHPHIRISVRPYCALLKLSERNLLTMECIFRRLNALCRYKQLSGLQALSRINRMIFRPVIDKFKSFILV